MRCIEPRRIKIAYNDTTKEAVNERIEKGKDPFFFQGFVPCGKCYNCLSRRRRAWTFRLLQELSCSKTGYFVTFTRNEDYNNKMHNEVSKSEMQNYLKHLKNKGLDFSYYLIGEYGTTTFRAHYHALFFLKSGCPDEFVQQIKYNYAEFKNVNGIWNRFEKGNISIYQITEAMVGYITHYHVRPKEHPAGTGQGAFNLMSKGLGRNFIENEEVMNYVRESGSPVVHDMNNNVYVLPRYYRKKYDIDIQQNTKYSFHQIFKSKNEYAKFKRLSLDNQIRKLNELKMSSKRRLDNYNKQIKVTSI